jgi:hypothetical protein
MASTMNMTNGHGISVPAEAQLRERGREVADAARSKDDQGQASEEGQGSQGNDQGGQPASRHEEAVHQAAQDPDEEDDGDPDPERHAGRPEEPEDRAGEAGHRLDGQVDLTGHDDQGHRQRHDRDFHQGCDEVREVAGRQEERRQRRPEDDEPDHDDDEQRLPAREQVRPAPFAVGGSHGCAHRARLSTVARWIRRRMIASALMATRMTTP